MKSAFIEKLSELFNGVLTWHPTGVATLEVPTEGGGTARFHFQWDGSVLNCSGYSLSPLQLVAELARSTSSVQVYSAAREVEYTAALAALQVLAERVKSA